VFNFQEKWPFQMSKPNLNHNSNLSRTLRSSSYSPPNESLNTNDSSNSSQNSPHHLGFQYGGHSGKQLKKNIPQKTYLFNQMNKETSASGQSITIIIHILSIVISVGLAMYIFNKRYYQFLMKIYERINGAFDPEEFFRVVINSFQDKCKSYIFGTIAAPVVFLFFAAWNFLSMLLAFCHISCCNVFHAFWAVVYGSLAIFYSQATCGRLYNTLFVLLGSNNMPEPSWPYYAGMAGFSLLSLLANCWWSSNKMRAKVEKKNFELLLDDYDC